MPDKIGEVYVEVGAKTDKLKKDFNKIKSDGKAAGKEAGTGFNKGFQKAIAIGLLITGVIKLIKKSVQAYNIQAEAENRLATALGGVNKGLLEQAAALQKITTFGDEAIINAQAILGAFTKNEDQLKALTVATLDFASANDMDLKSASSAIAKSFGSSTNMLQRYGVSVVGAVGSTERLAQITEGVAKLWGGTAQSKLNTFSGRMTNLKNRIGDVEEGIGKALVPTFEKLVGLFEQNLSTAEQTTGFFDAIAASGRILGAVFGVVWGVLNEVGTLLGTLGASIVALAIGKFDLAGRIISDGMGRMGTIATDTVKMVGNMFDGIGEKAQYIPERVVTPLDEGTDSLKEMQKATDDLTNADDKLKTKIEFLQKALENQNLTLRDRLAIIDELRKSQAEYQTLLDAPFGDLQPRGLEGLPTPEQDASQEVLTPVPEIAKPFQEAEESVSNMGNVFSSILNAGTNLANILGIAADSFAGKLISAFDTVNQIANSILNVIGAVAGGGGGGIFGLIGTLFGKQGGVFEGGKQIAKFAGGGDFIVPPGFSEDSFRMGVQSGERVTVTPSNRVGEDTKLLAAIGGKLDALNKNLANKDLISSPRITIDGDNITKAVYSTINKLQREGTDLNYL